MAGHRRSAASHLRIALRRLHLWLGLSLGLLFAVVGLTGSALVFYTGIDAALHPAVRTTRDAPEPSATSPVWDRALATGRARWHDAAGRWTLEVTGEGGGIPARYYPAAAPGHHGDRIMVWFSPDGRRIVRAERWGGYLMSWLYQLHMALLAGEAGGRVVGWSGVAMLALLLSGMASWWPRGSWRKALAFKRDAAAIRRLRDLHKLSGVGSVALLLVLVATGVLLALPAVTQVLIHPAAVPAPRSSGAGRGEVTIVAAFAASRAALPDGHIVFVDTPTAGNGAIRVRFQVPGDPHRRFPGSYVFVDRYSGRVLAVHDVRHAGTGTAMVSWIRTLHDGTVGGTATRILAMLLGCMPALLFVIAMLHWMRRRAATRRRRSPPQPTCQQDHQQPRDRQRGTVVGPYPAIEHEARRGPMDQSATLADP